MNREKITSFDGKTISVAIWDSLHPRGIVQISHGLSEHIARYDDFASFLSQSGYVVVGDDHRGHGETDRDSLGKARGKNIFENTVQDMLFLTQLFSSRYELPVVVLGHSYGSFLTRRYMSLQKSPLVKGYVLSGTAYMGGLQLAFGRLLANGKYIKHKDDDAKIIINNSFKKYDKKTKEGKHDWLSRDLVEVGKYNTDPLCGFKVSYGFYKHFFDGMNAINKQPSPANTGARILLASGENDRFGGMGKLTMKVYKNHIKRGENASLKLYEGARHEILNETNKHEVYSDFLEFINLCID